MKMPAIACVLALHVTSARADVAEPAADPADPSMSPSTETETAELGESYMGRIILADLGAIATFGVGGFLLLASALGGDETGGAGVAGAVLVSASIVSYVVTPPLLHVDRGNPRGAMRSALARAGLPLAGGLLAYLSDRRGEEDRIVSGVVVGMGGAMVLDWLLLARMPARTAPFVAPSGSGVQAGIAGSF